MYKENGKFRTKLQVNGLQVHGPTVACPKVCSARSRCWNQNLDASLE